MSNPSPEPRPARVRRHWLLLALLLFFGGQVLAAEHRHSDQHNLHSDCSVCVLSAAGGTASIDSGASGAIPAGTPLHRDSRCGRSLPAAVRFCDSRAPPRF